MPKVLVTPRSYARESLDRLRAAGYELVLGPAGRHPTREELLELLPGCAGWVAGVEKIPAEVLQAAPDLKVISRNGAGVDNIDVQAAQRLGIRICRAEGANAQGVAELTLGLIFALLRFIPFCDYHLKNKRWQRPHGTELAGKTLGVIGCGRIGGRVVRMALSLGMAVYAFDPRHRPDLTSLSNFHWTALEEVLRRADILSLHCPPQSDGPLMNAARLQCLKEGAYLVNTARADLVEESAILDALESGRLRGYATDVFPQEPPFDYTLIQHPRVVATPHIGASTGESIGRATRIAVDNLLEALTVAEGTRSC